jgi:release factor glutamine methyltransferase
MLIIDRYHQTSPQMEDYIRYYQQINAQRKDTDINIGGMTIYVDHRVFTPDPTITYAPLLVLKQLEMMDLKNKTVLDLGTGTGILGLYCLRKGAKLVYVVDCDEIALENARKNLATIQPHNVVIMKSDLFEKIPKSHKFDIILYNLPICGEVWGIDIHEMYERVYKEIRNYLESNGVAMHVFANFGDIGQLRQQMRDHHFDYMERIEKQFDVEWSLIMINTPRFVD